MKKQLILLLFIMVSVGLHAQKTATGYVLDKDSHAALEGVKVQVEGEKNMAITNKNGEFAVEVLKGRRKLVFSKDNYTPLTYSLKPGFQRGKIRMYLESYKAVNAYSKKRLEKDSLFSTFKNAVSLSIIEFFAVGIGLRYERFLAQKHAVGLHATYYFNGISTNHYGDMGGGYTIKSTYTGYKIVPFYRYYLSRKKTMGFFLDAKIPFGYFDFDKLVYRYRTSSHLDISTSPSFWTWGFGVSVGIMTRMPGTKHGVINFSLGYQYFPMADVPKSIPREVSGGTFIPLETETNWWKGAGPGASFEVKFTIGGIF